ncbi:MAG: DUF1444 family protein [Tepidisphaera sp.]|jgi:uncharacterized protein YtpQ (UPF0354 family)
MPGKSRDRDQNPRDSRNEPQDFAQMVAQLLRDRQPDFSVDLTGPREMLVNGRRLDLENLHRMVTNEPDRSGEIIEHYVEQLFASDAARVMTMALDFARPRIMPRIQPETIFEHLAREQVAHIPFVNGTVVVFVTDLPQMTVSITTEQVLRWNLTVDDLDLIARENLEKYAPELDVQFVESKEGGKAAILGHHDGYDAARLLMGDLHQRLAPHLGGDFYVATPARDMFVALSTGPEKFVRRLHARVEQDYRRLPYPITHDLFYVTRDGVAGTRAEPEEQREAA